MVDKLVDLSSCSTLKVDTDLHRYSSPHQQMQAIRALGIDSDDVQGVLDFLQVNVTDPLNQLLDEPFRPRPRGPARYSDERLLALYGTLEAETAEAEVSNRELAGSGEPRLVYYEHFTCRLRGSALDIRGKRHDWLHLTDVSVSAYPQCQAVAHAAQTIPIDAIYAPSVRHAEGTNVPVYRRTALSDPVIRNRIVFEVTPSSTRVVSRLAI